MTKKEENDLFTKMGTLDERTENLNKVTQEIKLNQSLLGQELHKRISDNHKDVNDKMDSKFEAVNLKIDTGFEGLKSMIAPMNDDRNKAKGALRIAYILIGLALTVLGLVITMTKHG